MEEQNNDNTGNGTPERNPWWKNFLNAFIPKGDYFFTAIILDLNILVWIAMCLTGSNPIAPDSNDLVIWGANSRNLTLVHGQIWRMFTCMFVHFGIIHLAANMYAFFVIGRMLETFIGKWRFLILYICSGLGASAVSMWWHEDSVAVGASGAIFGTFGVFAALLTTDLINKEVRGRMLRGMLQAIGINLLIGLSWHIDNSAHIGGLITGTIGGYLIYFDLKKFYYQKINSHTFVFLSAVITFIGILIFRFITPLGGDVESLMLHFEQTETSAQHYLIAHTNEQLLENVEKNFIQPWQRCRAIADSLEGKNDITDSARIYFHGLGAYAEMKLNAGDYFLKAKKEKNSSFIDSAYNLNRKADEVRKKMLLLNFETESK